MCTHRVPCFLCTHTLTCGVVNTHAFNVLLCRLYLASISLLAILVVRISFLIIIVFYSFHHNQQHSLI